MSRGSRPSRPRLPALTYSRRSAITSGAPPLVPFFQRKLALTPIQLDHPVWVPDSDLDLEYHFRHVSLPKPGTREQLETLVARLHMVLLDRTRPLWQYYVIEGIESGGFAVYIKMHQPASTAAPAWRRCRSFLALGRPRADCAVGPTKEARTPEIFELISDSYAKFFTQQREFYQSWPDIGKAIAKVGATRHRRPCQSAKDAADGAEDTVQCLAVQSALLCTGTLPLARPRPWQS